MNSTKDFAEYTNKLLDQTHPYVNGIALRETILQSKQSMTPDNEQSKGCSVHNSCYMNKPSLIVNKCYDFDPALYKRNLMANICDMSEEYI